MSLSVSHTFLNFHSPPPVISTWSIGPDEERAATAAATSDIEELWLALTVLFALYGVILALVIIYAVAITVLCCRSRQVQPVYKQAPALVVPSLDENMLFDQMNSRVHRGPSKSSADPPLSARGRRGSIVGDHHVGHNPEHYAAAPAQRFRRDLSMDELPVPVRLGRAFSTVSPDECSSSRSNSSASQ